jgi:membrane protein DedA with SNARE-associated domain
VGGITGTVTGWIGDAGVYAIFVLSVIDAVFPAASEVVMLYAGALAAGAFPDQSVSLFGFEIQSTGWAYVVVALAGTIGYWLGSMLGWGIGRYGGRPLLERHGRWLHLTPDNLDRAERWFERRGDSTVFLTRMLPIIRSFISIPAGVAEMRFGRYSILTLLGTLPWYFGLAAAGVALGSGWERVHDRFRYADYVAIGLIVLALVYLIVRTVRRRRIREREALERGS